MRKVLWITYLFPPLNCGVGRQFKVAKYLPQHGWQPVVLSVAKSRMRPHYDHSMVADIPAEVEVHRTFSLENKLLMSRVPRLLHINPSWFLVPDPFVGWVPFAVRCGKKILKDHKIDAIFSTSLPHTSHLPAYLLHRKSRLPWVADFRDPWIDNTYVKLPRPVQRLHARMEGAVVRSADMVTTTTEPWKDDIRANYPDEPAEKFRAITHGYDPDDFPGNARSNPAFPGKLTVTYTGSLYGKRRADTLMQAVRELLDEDPAMGEKLVLRFVGKVATAEALSRQLGLEQVTSFSGMVTHREVWDLLRASDVLLFLIGSGELDEKAFAGKLAEYLAIGKPILAAIPEGVAATVIRNAKMGEIVDPEDKDGLKRVMSELYRRWQQGSLGVTPDPEALARHDIRRIAGEFAAVLEQAVERAGERA